MLSLASRLGAGNTPNFNRLMKDSMYFSNFYHQTGQGRTSDADFVTHSSLLPLPTGSVFTRYADREYDTLPEILRSRVMPRTCSMPMTAASGTGRRCIGK